MWTGTQENMCELEERGLCLGGGGESQVVSRKSVRSDAWMQSFGWEETMAFQERK